MMNNYSINSSSMLLLLVFSSLLILSCSRSLPKNFGKLDIEIFTPDSVCHSLVVGFGGGEGGNAWASDYWADVRNQFLKEGFAFMAVGYFGSENTPKSLDRISLDAVHDSIMNVQNRITQINSNKVFVIGGSKGGELVLNLASRYDDISGVVAIVPSHVSFPANTIAANTSSWSFKGKELPFVPAPFKTIFPAIRGDLHSAFSMMLEDHEAVETALIEVENINGPVLILSASEDEMWPSTNMSNAIMNRLKEKGHAFESFHHVIQGSHNAPLDHFDEVLKFLKKNVDDQ